MDKCSKTAALYIATLKSIYFIHQQNHWLASGNDFYGDHLLLQRIYESAQKDLDAAAEKFIGILGPEALDFKLQTDLLHKVLSKYSDISENKIECSLAIEKDFVRFSKVAYECFESEGKMTLGLDDLIMSIANSREESIYLLQQALGKRASSGK